MAFELRSPAFAQGQEISVKHTCDGADLSPPLTWSAPPANTKGFALIVDDPDAPVGTYGGPCPPRGPAHRYFFKLYALDVESTLPAGKTKAELLKAIDGHVLSQAELNGALQAQVSGRIPHLARTVTRGDPA